MRILLVKPPSSKKQLGGDEVFMGEPLELEYVAAGLSDNHDVRIIDLRLEPSFEKHLEEFIPDIVGLTSYTSQVYIVRDLCKKIKAFNPHILTVVGGVHATLGSKDFCDPNINIIVRGEGVFAFRNIVERFEKNQDLYDVGGIAFYQDKQLKFTKIGDIPNIDHLPLPNRSLTKHYREKYFVVIANEFYKPLATVLTSRGCPYRCKFCSVWKMGRGKYQARDPRNVLKELETIKEPYVYFADDETFIDIKGMDKLADLIIDSGMKKSFFTFGRSDTVVNHPDLFQKWRKAGLGGILVGLESNRDSVLDYLRKRNTTSNNEKAVSILKEIGIFIVGTFIVFPDYDLGDFDYLATYINNLGIDTAFFSPLTPLPGTELYDELKDQLTTNDLELFDLSHVVLPTKLHLEKFYREMAYIYFRTNKPSKGKFDQSFKQKARDLHQAIRNRHLHHQTE